MKTYNVVWVEDHSVNVQAESKEEAVQKVFDGDYDTAQEAAEMGSSIEAHEIKVK